MSGTHEKYAKPERERRFLLAAVPAEARDAREIVDRYVIGTRLRLRTVDAGGKVTRKLGQKIRPDPSDPRLVLHTTMYLSQHEYDALAALPARTLRKTRRTVDLARVAMSVDAFHDVLAGLVTAEIDFPDDVAMHGFAPPGFCIAEVSRDERFTGGELATTDRDALAGALDEVGGLRLPS